MTKIKKILIANRGEIACRVMRTASRLGIKTVAVYSDADKKALHVRTADEAVHIGPSPAAESYLVIDKIIDACKQTGADAVHPGYGFLSENPGFVRACEKAGIKFIGPSAESMEAMGLKDAAKKLMEKAGVPVTPGYHGKDQDPAVLARESDNIGYPVLIKAVAGGGGKGMRKVEDAKDFADALKSCQREAKSSFGNDDVLIEKYIQSPRHIEVQIFGDSHGNVVHMFERDCSLQRRHQKVIEEAPAPGMTDAVRKAMTDAAVDAAKAVDYVGAGTVEFIVDGSGALKTDGFWFMEMNTRLQVEHPVSEMITGYDFVELQIRVAEGGKLPKQNDIKMKGHAVEARLYAEDPANDFLPSIGRLSEGVSFANWKSQEGYHRIDTGVSGGDRITPFYDPMIAKVIGFGPDRDTAIMQCEVGIQTCLIDGIAANDQFLINCLSHEQFEKGEVSTGFIETYKETLIWPKLLDLDETYALVGAQYFSAEQDNPVSFFKPSRELSKPTPFDDYEGWRNNLEDVKKVWFLRGQEAVEVEYVASDATSVTLLVNGKPIQVFDEDDYSLELNIDNLLKYRGFWDFHVFDDGISIEREATFVLVPFFSSVEMTFGNSSNTLTAPMPGKIIAINVKAGDAVQTGDKLIVMEAMKMEMSLEAPRDGIVADIPHNVGDLVSDGEVLLELETE